MSVNRPTLPNIDVLNTYMKLKNTLNPCNAKIQGSDYDPTYVKGVMLLREVQVFIQLQKFTPQL